MLRNLLLLIVLLSVYTTTLSTEFVSTVSKKQITQEYNKQVECLAKNIYWESASESYEGKLAVAQVTLNRVNSGKFPSDICAVVYQKTVNRESKTVCQFSWTCLVNGMKKKDKYEWEQSLMIAKRALTEPILHDIIAQTNALYYHAVYVTPGWPKVKVVKRIGNHIFYSTI
jgi:spore germination cell wall hydrolase CwlJ-like protein